MKAVSFIMLVRKLFYKCIYKFTYDYHNIFKIHDDEHKFGPNEQI